MTLTPDCTDITLRRILAALFLIGALGTAAELLLLDHTESATQLAPLALLTIGSGAIALCMYRPGRGGLRLVQGLMLLFLVSGAVGVLLHLRSNLELEREMRPEEGDVSLLWDAIKGGTPTLAPGTMILLGGLGLAFTYRHPAAARLSGSAHGN